MATQNFVVKVTTYGVTFNTGKETDPIHFVRGAKNQQEAMATLNNVNVTKRESILDNGRKMISYELTNVVKIDLSFTEKIKDRATLLSSL